MENNQSNFNDDSNDQTITQEMKPHVIKNFVKELKRTKWPIHRYNNKKFFNIFIFILMLVGFFALISLGATELIKLIGAN